MKIKISKKLAMSILTTGALMYLAGPAVIQSGGVPLPGGGVIPVPPGGTWTPKWAVGDLIRSHNLPSASWTIYGVNYETRRYQVLFNFAGASDQIYVDAANIEGSDLYKWS